MGELQERPCPRCGLIMGPFDESCPRCARLTGVTCSQCGLQGTIGECDQCQQPVCDACSSRQGEKLLCRSCLAVATGGAHYRRQPAPAAASGLPETGMEAGLGSSFGRALVFMRESFAMGFADLDLLLPSLLSLVLSVGLVAATYFGAKAAGVDLRGIGEEGRHSPLLQGGVLAIALVAAFIHYVTVGATVSLVAAHLRGENARVGAAFRDALKHWGAIAVMALVSTVVSALTSRRRRSLAGEAVERVWIVASYLIIPVIMLEDLGFGQAGSRALELHRKNLLGIAIGEIGVEVVSRVAVFIFAVIFGLGLFLALQAGRIALPFALGAGFLALMVLAGFMMYLRTAYYTCLYLWAAEREAAGEAVPAPAPLARALGY